jgi:hypothetical protein
MRPLLLDIVGENLPPIDPTFMVLVRKPQNPIAEDSRYPIQVPLPKNQLHP